jgi:hypothetical protein
MIRRRWSARVAGIVVVGMCALLGSGVAASSASALHPVATVGMPFKGQWASDVLVAPPFTNAPSYPAVDPANNGGDWATNLWGPEGTPIKLLVTSPDGPVTFHWVASDASCDGNSSKMDVFVNSTKVGWIYFAHFLGGRGNNISDPQPTNGMTLGTMHDFPAPPGCNAGPHVHIEMSNNFTTFSCWTDNGQPGVTLNEGTAVGMLGSSNTGPHQPCTSPAATGTNFNKTTISGNQQLAGADLGGANLNQATISGNQALAGANLTGANLNKATISGNQALAGANLTGANLNKTKISGTLALSGAILTGADLHGASITGTQALLSAVYSNTTCPDGTNSDNHGNTCVGHGVP